MCFVVFAVIFVKGDLSPLLGRIRYLGSNQCFNKGGVSQLLGHIRYIGSNKGLWGLKSTWVTFDFTSYIEVSILAREWSNFGILEPVMIMRLNSITREESILVREWSNVCIFEHILYKRVWQLSTKT